MLRVTSDLNNLNTIREFVESYATKLGMTPADIYGIVLATDEAATNICIHGYQNGSGPIEVTVEHDDQNIIIGLRDKAPVFDPTTAPPPKLTGSLEERALGGVGIHFMRSYTDAITHRAIAPQGNELVLTKSIRGEKKP